MQTQTEQGHYLAQVSYVLVEIMVTRSVVDMCQCDGEIWISSSYHGEHEGGTLAGVIVSVEMIAMPIAEPGGVNCR